MAQDKTVVLVTGGDKGIGKQVVRQMASPERVVYLAARDRGRGEAARTDLRDAGADIRVLSLEVTDDQSIAEAAAILERDCGKLYILVNNAGIGGDLAPPSQTTRAMMRRVYDTNVFGPVAVTRAMLPLMKQGEGRMIVNVSSEMGSLTLHGYPDFPYAGINVLSYCSSKTALNAFTVLLAKELNPAGFRVNAVNPGFTATDLNDHRGVTSPEEAAEIIVQYATPSEKTSSGRYVMAGGDIPW